MAIAGPAVSWPFSECPTSRTWPSQLSGTTCGVDANAHIGRTTLNSSNFFGLCSESKPYSPGASQGPRVNGGRGDSEAHPLAPGTRSGQEANAAEVFSYLTCRGGGHTCSRPCTPKQLPTLAFEIHAIPAFFDRTHIPPRKSTTAWKELFHCWVAIIPSGFRDHDVAM